MCELTIYVLKNGLREKAMEGAVRLTVLDGSVRAEGIFGDSKEIAGRLAEVDIIGQQATIVAI